MQVKTELLATAVNNTTPVVLKQPSCLDQLFGKQP